MGVTVVGGRGSGGIAMSRRNEKGREARQRLPGGLGSAGEAAIGREATTLRSKLAKRRKVVVTVRPSGGGAPITLSGRAASVARQMIRRGWVSALDVPRGWRLPWFVSLIAAAGLEVSREWFVHGDQRMKRYRLACPWTEETRP